MLAIHYLKDAVFAESVPAFGDVRVIESLKADDALCKLADNILYRYLDLFVVLRPLPLQGQRWLNHLINDVNSSHRFSDALNDFN